MNSNDHDAVIDHEARLRTLEADRVDWDNAVRYGWFTKGGLAVVGALIGSFWSAIAKKLGLE